MEFIVERIEGEKRFKQRSGRHVTKYLVKWEGYDDRTWEPIRNLKNCKDKIAEFKARRVIDNSDEDQADEQAQRREEATEVLEDASTDDSPNANGRPVASESDEGNPVDGEVELGDGEEDATTSTARDNIQAVILKEPYEASRTKLRRRTVTAPKSASATTEFDFAISDSDNEYTIERDSDPSVDDSGSDHSTSLLEEASVEVGSDLEACEVDTEDEAGADGSTELEELEVAVLAGAHDALKSDRLKEMAKNDFVQAYYGDDTSSAYEKDDLYGSDPCPTPAAELAAKTMRPIDLFFFFMPKSLWSEVASQTNKYQLQSLESRLAAVNRRIRQKYTRAEAVDRIADAEQRIQSFESINPHELLHVIGLLIARSMCPMRMGIEMHWKPVQTGAVPAGTWSRYMSRKRFKEIIQFLHFSVLWRAKIELGKSDPSCKYFSELSNKDSKRAGG